MFFCRLPLAESKQMFTAMDLSLRQQFHTMMDKMADAHHMEHLVFSSFTLHHGCRYRFQASDFVYAIIALLNPTVSTCTLKIKKNILGYVGLGKFHYFFIFVYIRLLTKVWNISAKYIFLKTFDSQEILWYLSTTRFLILGMSQTQKVFQPEL